ncbi:hypothetical protein [Saccharibacillus brassicae]|uniref:Uncharacterized protein n=1 Tax=Saccharibacillus brassicae TaxID=2583377 RepID=A0A4Y6V0A7_SACBS|nr:hypothetical protein [Saccharibacillus brassicae]QDH23482.1 hypothetical protein FFV09_23020 [Saccharibacillus brassicae]
MSGAYWVTTEKGYHATLELAERMGTPAARQVADLFRPGEPLRPPYDREVPACWVDDGWVRLAEPAPPTDAAEDVQVAGSPPADGQVVFSF